MSLLCGQFAERPSKQCALIGIPKWRPKWARQPAGNWEEKPSGNVIVRGEHNELWSLLARIGDLSVKAIDPCELIGFGCRIDEHVEISKTVYWNHFKCWRRWSPHGFCRIGHGRRTHRQVGLHRSRH